MVLAADPCVTAVFLMSSEKKRAFYTGAVANTNANSSSQAPFSTTSAKAPAVLTVGTGGGASARGVARRASSRFDVQLNRQKSSDRRRRSELTMDDGTIICLFV